MNIINCLNGYTKPSWTIEKIISNAKEIIASCMNIHISHEFHECNVVADSLANIGVQADEVIIFNNVADLKDDTKSMINYDKIMHKEGSSDIMAMTCQITIEVKSLYDKKWKVEVNIIMRFISHTFKVISVVINKESNIANHIQNSEQNHQIVNSIMGGSLK